MPPPPYDVIYPWWTCPECREQVTHGHEHDCARALEGEDGDRADDAVRAQVTASLPPSTSLRFGQGDAGVMESKRVCPECGAQLHRRAYLMALDPDAPDARAILRGESGDAARLALTLVLCVLAALILTGARAVLGL